jgi:hypothetical protein
MQGLRAEGVSSHIVEHRATGVQSRRATGVEVMQSWRDVVLLGHRSTGLKHGYRGTGIQELLTLSFPSTSAP